MDIKDYTDSRAENIKQKEEIKSLQEAVSKQKHIIEEKIKQLKVIIKDADHAQVRVKLLKAKSDRSSLLAKVSRTGTGGGFLPCSC